MSYASLMKHLSGLCRTIVVPKFTMDQKHQFTLKSAKTLPPERAFKLLQLPVP